MELIGLIIERSEKGQALDMVPVKMRDQDVGADGAARKLLHQRLPEHSQTTTTIGDEQGASVRTKFQAGGVSPVP